VPLIRLGVKHIAALRSRPWAPKAGEQTGLRGEDQRFW
jgi:hypothetical protein